MIEERTDRELLRSYATDELRGNGVYRGYKPRVPLLAQLAHDRPAAHVVVVSATWCPDCRREVPKLARIFDELPASWTVELRGDDDVTRSTLEVRAIPTFIVQDAPGGRELGRIIEAARSQEGIEGDLLAIAQGR